MEDWKTSEHSSTEVPDSDVSSGVAAEDMADDEDVGLVTVITAKVRDDFTPPEVSGETALESFVLDSASDAGFEHEAPRDFDAVELRMLLTFGGDAAVVEEPTESVLTVPYAV